MKNQKTKSANKIVYVDEWLIQYGEPDSDGVMAEPLSDGRWVCEINIPLVDQTVKAVAKSAANAMANASDKALPLIEQYLSEHPKVTFLHKSLFHHYEFYIDKYGNTNIRRNPEYRKKEGQKDLEMRLACSKAIEKAVAKITKINGTDKDLFIQVIDKSWFDESDTIDDIQQKIRRKMLGDTSDWFIAWEVASIVGNCVIVVGHILED
jgi:hypothetical protein